MEYCEKFNRFIAEKLPQILVITKVYITPIQTPLGLLLCCARTVQSISTRVCRVGARLNLT